MWEELQSVMSPTQNYITYRNYFKTIEKPAFPYFGNFHTHFFENLWKKEFINFQKTKTLFWNYFSLGMYLSDLTLIQEKYQSKVTGGLLNFKKMK